MTAYGRSSVTTDSGEFVCELRSVNHRYLDVSVRLPESLRPLEPVMRERLSIAAKRGKVEVSIKHTASYSNNQFFTVNEGLLTQLLLAAEKVSSLSGASGNIDPIRMLQWPGVLSTSADSIELLTKDAMAVFDLAVGDFIDARGREGSQISRMLQARIEQVLEKVGDIRVLRPLVIEKQRDKLIAKLAEINAEHDFSRLEQELVYAAQRYDIAEELDRLEAHCDELSKILVRIDPVGRRLDFLMQEFNREANTVNSKSSDFGTGSAALEIKVLIEQMREQVQNVE